MKAYSLSILLSLGLCAALQAQLTVKVQTMNEAGFTLLRGNGSSHTKSFPSNKVFSTFEDVFTIEGSPRTYLKTQITPPYVSSRATWNRFAISNTYWTQKGSGHNSLQTTGKKTGAPGVQKARITITTSTPKTVILDCLAAGTIYDNASVTYSLKGPGVKQSWTFNTAGKHNMPFVTRIAVNRIAHIDVEVTATVKPGSGTHHYDGFSSSFRIYPIEDRTASFKVFGQGCGTATMAGSGAVVSGQFYTIQTNQAPANTPVALLFGRSRTAHQTMTLPYSLTSIGATGCFLNVNFVHPVNRTTDALGHAEVKLLTSRFNAGTWYAQWVVLDPLANPAGITLSPGGELRY